MQSIYVIPLVLIVASFAFSIWMRSRAAASAGPALRAMFEQTGYRHADMPNAPIEAHIRRSEELSRKRGDSRVRMVRNVEGRQLYWEQWTQIVGSGWSTGCMWTMPLERLPRASFHIAEKRLVGAGKAIKEFMSSSKRNFTPAFEQQHAIGDAALDQRFVMFAVDPYAAREALAQPVLRALLLGCTEVDLVVKAHEVRFNDPSQVNLRNAMGGAMGMLAAASSGDAGKSNATITAVHDHIARVMVAAGAS